jgi:hypothetical protein
MPERGGGFWDIAVGGVALILSRSLSSFMSPSRHRRFLWALFCSLVGASLSALDTATPATKGADIEQKLVRDCTRPAEPEPVAPARSWPG